LGKFYLKQDILESIEDVNDLLASYELLLIRIKQSEPDNIELAALGTVLHSFYNGIEGIFLLVSKQIDKETPNDSSWHQSLLHQVATPTEKRERLLSPEAASLLAPYMRFRHFFRHAYAFMLDWRRLKPLADDLDVVWETVKRDMVEFCNSYS
jgi:hypothetical protein